MTIRACLAVLAVMLTSSAPVHAVQTNAPAVETASKIKVTTVAKGLANPWGLQFLPDGRPLVTEKPGRIRIIGADGKPGAPVTGVPAVASGGQGGLLDIALAPDFATSGTVYFAFSEPRDGGNGTSVAKATLRIEGDSGRLESVEVIFRQLPTIDSTFHFGSRIVITAEGSLFVTTGDRNSQRKEAQNPANHIGKIIHILPSGAPAAGNPQRDGWDAKVWSIGHRNLQGAALDADGRLWTVEHGARGGDELNRPESGKNYGWPVISYGREYWGLSIGEGSAKEGLEQPVYYWDPSIATSGLLFYSGDKFPEWKGNAFVGGLKGLQLARLVLNKGEVIAQEKLLGDLDERIRDVRQGPDGAIWVLTDDTSDGKVLRLDPAGG